MSTPPLPGRAVAGVPCTLRTRTVRVHGAMEDVPLLDRIELAGTTNDVARVRAGLARFWGTVPMAQTGKLECLTTA